MLVLISRQVSALGIVHDRGLGQTLPDMSEGGTMRRIEIEISEAEAALLEQLAARCSEINKEREGATSHGELTVEGLITMLTEDAATVIRRPGSWEGSNMHTVLTAHGYDV
ncbi:hypothetical protein CHELA1G11_40163 [Hyphomicrobiales bacterium]|nr:hypothetical protein CHELA1G2_40148 [Hyphomicrobiales bacterium]CAH1696652.1 hypothetical protein CHELA1G11_40163 [Hyphomicrobiales bacterium]